MTAILGFTCTDSVLMMADTEETTSHYTKSDCDKLYRFNSPSGTIITGGAGDAHLLDCANQALQQYFASGLPDTPDIPLTGQIVLDALNSFAQKFFSETTARYAASGMNPLPEFQLLIAVNIHKKQTLLFKLSRNEVLWLPPSRHECIGSGVLQLHPMLRDFQFVTTKETALFCGFRMMYQAKRIIQGVGGRTEAMALLNDGATIYFGTDNISRIEELAVNFEEFLGKFVYTSVSNVSSEFPEIDENCEKGFANVPGLLKQYRDKYKELLNNPIV
jgi:hypothetical protein